MIDLTRPAGESLLLTVDDTAQQLSISRTTVFRLLRAGDLDSQTIDTQRLIPRQALDRFIQERTKPRSAAKEEGMTHPSIAPCQSVETRPAGLPMMGL